MTTSLNILFLYICLATVLTAKVVAYTTTTINKHCTNSPTTLLTPDTRLGCWDRYCYLLLFCADSRMYLTRILSKNPTLCRIAAIPQHRQMLYVRGVITLEREIVVHFQKTNQGRHIWPIIDEICQNPFTYSYATSNDLDYLCPTPPLGWGWTSLFNPGCTHFLVEEIGPNPCLTRIIEIHEGIRRTEATGVLDARDNDLYFTNFRGSIPVWPRLLRFARYYPDAHLINME